MASYFWLVEKRNKLHTEWKLIMKSVWILGRIEQFVTHLRRFNDDMFIYKNEKKNYYRKRIIRILFNMRKY